MVPDDDATTVYRAMEILRASEAEVFRTAYQAWFGAPLEENILAQYLSVYRRAGVAPFWVRHFVRELEGGLPLCPDAPAGPAFDPRHPSLESRIRQGLTLWYALYGPRGSPRPGGRRFLA